MSHVDDGTLHELVDNALDAAMRVEVEAHLASCGDCARRYAEATAMARQIVTLLGALDVPVPRIRVMPPVTAAGVAPSVAGGATVIPMRSRMTVLQRVAIAASVMLVAGVSYQVGKRGDAAAKVVAMDRDVSASMRAAPMRAAPSVVDGIADSFMAAPAPSARQRTRGGPRAESEMVASGAGATAGVAGEAAAVATPVVVPPPLPRVTAPPQGALAQKSIAPGAPADRDDARREQNVERRVSIGDAETPSQSSTARQIASQTPAQTPAQTRSQAPVQAATPATTQDVLRKASSPESMNRSAVAGGEMQSALPKVIPLAGYSTVEEASVPAMTRRRYISAAGTEIDLSIMQSFDDPKRTLATVASTPEFVVTSVNGRSTVRWHARGLDYVLQGAVSPDSLIKLATQLKR